MGQWVAWRSGAERLPQYRDCDTGCGDDSHLRHSLALAAPVPSGCTASVIPSPLPIAAAASVLCDVATPRKSTSELNGAAPASKKEQQSIRKGSTISRESRKACLIAARWYMQQRTVSLCVDGNHPTAPGRQLVDYSGCGFRQRQAQFHLHVRTVREHDRSQADCLDQSQQQRARSNHRLDLATQMFRPHRFQDGWLLRVATARTGHDFDLTYERCDRGRHRVGKEELAVPRS